jgi:hypothetical protein
MARNVFRGILDQRHYIPEATLKSPFTKAGTVRDSSEGHSQASGEPAIR